MRFVSRVQQIRSGVVALSDAEQSRNLAFGGALLALVVVASLLVAVSPARADGASWTPVAAAEGNRWQSVAYGNGVWVAVADNGDNRVMRSTDDGVSWNNTGITGVPADEWTSVAYGDEVWVAVSFDGTVMRSTNNGLTWNNTGITGVQAGVEWLSVAYGNGVWVAVGAGSIPSAKLVMRSEGDGKEWTPVDAAEQNGWQSVAYGGGVWVAVGDSSADDPKLVMRSEDNGEEWTPVEAAEDNGWLSVAYGDGVWIAVSYNGVNRVMRSNDGESWTAVKAAEQNVWQSVAYGNGVWVAVADNGDNRVMRSTNDVESWTAVAAAEDNRWQSVAYGNGVWVAVADNGDNPVMRSGAPLPVLQPQSTLVPPSVSCVPETLVVGGIVTCTVSGGDAGIDILWRAAYNPVFAGEGVTLDASGSGEFSFMVPAAALGQELTVELVEWTAPISLGVVGGPVPSSVPSGEGPVPMWSLALLALAGLLLRRRGMRAQA